MKFFMCVSGKALIFMYAPAIYDIIPLEDILYTTCPWYKKFLLSLYNERERFSSALPLKKKWKGEGEGYGQCFLCF